MSNQQHEDNLVYRSLFESSPGLFVVLEPGEFRIRAVSDSFLEMTMRTRDELLGKVMFDAFPDDPSNPDASGTTNLLASLNRVKATRSRDVMAVQRHPIVNPDTGALEERYWAPMNSPVLDQDGNVTLLIHRTEDITEYVKRLGVPTPDVVNRGELNLMVQAQEMKRLNQTLLMSQQRLQAIFRDASLGIAATDLAGHFTDANEAYCRMLGYTLAELKQLNVLDITHPDDREENLQLREELKNGTRSSFFYEKRYLTKTGSTLWSRINASLLRDDNGTATNLIAIVEDITAHRNAEEALRQSRVLERMGGRIAKVGGLVAERKAPGAPHEVFWAREIYDIFDHEDDTPPDLTAVLALLNPTGRALLVRAMDECWQGKPFDIEFQITTFRGNSKWLRLAAEPEANSHGDIIRLIGAVQDITRQKHEQRNLQELSSRFFATLESMSDAFYLLDTDWRILYMNSEAERILGVRRDEVVGQGILDKFPTFRDGVAHRGFLEAIRTQKVWRAEYYSPPLDNWLSTSAYPSAEGLAVFFRSVTGEKQLQQQIAKSEERLKYITGAALDVVWDVDLVARTSWYNDGLKRKYGYGIANETVDTGYWLDKVHPADAARLSARLDKVLAGTQTEWTETYRFHTGFGTYVHFEDRGYILRDAAGKALRMVGGSTDITRRLEMEEQLLQTQRLESVGQLTGGIAHDFNNLLTVILGNTQLLQEYVHDNPALRSLTDIINLAATRGADLTRHLLAFSRKQALQPMTIDINQLLANLKGMLSRTLGGNIMITHNSQPDLWPAFVDPSQLEVALLNLCINSRDAMPEGGSVTIETRNVTLDETYSLSHSDVQPGSYVQISVNDTGTGIPPEIVDRVFEPFFTTKEKGKGTGLGLSTVFGFVKQSNGHINVYSEPGRGTSIRIYLPRSEQQVEEPVAQTNGQTSKPQGGQEVILLVEDNELVRKFGYDQLLALGYRVFPAADGPAALDILRSRGDIDLLFTDVVMPVMSGAELARQARALQPGLRVLFASGYTQDKILNDGQLDRDVYLLEKPFNRAALANKVRTVLNAPPPKPSDHG